MWKRSLRPLNPSVQARMCADPQNAHSGKNRDSVKAGASSTGKTYRALCFPRLYGARRIGCNGLLKSQKVKCIGFGKIRDLYSVYERILFQDAHSRYGFLHFKGVCLPLQFHLFKSLPLRFFAFRRRSHTITASSLSRVHVQWTAQA